MTAKVLMVQGSSSSAGKSLLVTALCRIFARRGVRVAPFKAQNMSNNAAVCPTGGEIGRAQALQAAACGLEPAVDMNPVLIKPEADARSQVVVMGRPWRTLGAKNYYDYKASLWEQVTGALDRLRASYELVIIEGAGSAAELNLRTGDIVNMAVARYAQAPVLLVGDIDRGGIFAQLIGTLWLLEPEERALVRGLVVNKFRGDPALFVDGVRILEEKAGVPVLGVVPFLRDLYLPEEDAVAIDRDGGWAGASDFEVDIAVVHLPCIANFDDFDPLQAEPGVRLRYVDAPEALGQPNAVILPGTKSTVGDLEWLRQTRFAALIENFARRGGAVVGICGGYQMLGEVISDPEHIEASGESTPGLGLLPTNTRFVPAKATYRARASVLNQAGWLAQLAGQTVSGYEIHMGATEGSRPWLKIIDRNNEPVDVPDGAISASGRVWGCYLHGLFANENLRHAWLKSLGWKGSPPNMPSAAARFADSLDRVGEAVEAALDMKRLEAILSEG